MHVKTTTLFTAILALGAGSASLATATDSLGSKDRFVKVSRDVNLAQHQVRNFNTSDPNFNATASKCSEGRHRDWRHGKGRGRKYWRHRNSTRTSSTEGVATETSNVATLPVETPNSSAAAPTTSAVNEDGPEEEEDDHETASSVNASSYVASSVVASPSSASEVKATSVSSSAVPTTTSSAVQIPASSAAPPTSSVAPSTGTAPDDFSKAILAAHNSARSTHDAPAMTWSDDLTASAKSWAEKCVWKHGGANGAGQNLAASAGSQQSADGAVGSWMSEEKDYNPNNPNYSHFTQVVWKASTQLGCFQATCPKLRNEDGSETFPGFSTGYFTVCNYSPAGNVMGQFPDNVSKTL